MQWGRDEQALERRAAREAEMQAAATVLAIAEPVTAAPLNSTATIYLCLSIAGLARHLLRLEATAF